MIPAPPLAGMLQALRDTLVYMKAGGCTGFDCSDETLKILARFGKPDRIVQTMDEGMRDELMAAPETLDAIQADLGACTRCELSRRRTHIVFGEGDPGARLVFVGEGPGFEEDRSGRPFVGPAGQLLTRIIAAMQLSRESVYICNIVKCRPPDNRNPAPDEIACCLPFLKRQLAAIRPQVICALGSVAAKTLLETDAPISRLRGRFHTVMGIPVMPTFHPAFLLRNPEKKREVWDDVQLIMQRLN
jgi:uracil-DNA glycosylase family 4